MDQIIEKLIFQLFNIKETIDIKKHTIEIENLRDFMEKENSLAIMNPQLAKEWHPTKNGKLTPFMFSHFSSKKFWWQCKRGHEWLDSISHRNSGRNCPYCSNQRLLIGYNDLATTNPQLAKEWHPTKNENLMAIDVMAGTQKKVWWLCKKEHEWQARIDHRNRGVGCPYCNGSYVIKGENDLATLNPQLANEWHPVKNGELKPSMFLCGSGQKVWWQCKNGHEWEAMIANRNNGRGCPYCKNGFLKDKSNSLQVMNPQLVKEWNYQKNGNLTPNNVTYNSHKKVWWICCKKHEWQEKVVKRSGGHNCPYCTGKLVIQGENDLATLNPRLANEWHPTKNGNLNPTMFTQNSIENVWWKCDKEHEWQATIIHRNNGANCPYCNNQRVLKGFNDLATKYPNLSKEWHPSKNEDLTPYDVTCGSHKKVWWICDKGHEWQVDVVNRSKGSNCPYCTGRYAIQGETDLATLNPQLASEWHPTKNKNLLPTMVTCNSDKKVWWKCNKGHEWEAKINNRNHNKGCPYCKNHYSIRKKNDV